MRGIAAPVLIVLASFALLAATLALYAERNLLDSDRFTERAIDALEDDRAQEAAGRALTDEVVLNLDPDLIGLRPVIQAVGEALVDSEPFRLAVRTGVSRAHRAAFRGQRDETAVTAANVGVLAIEAVERLDPELARQIPKDLDAKLIEFEEGGVGLDLVQVTREVDVLALVLPLAALLLYAAAIAVAPDRRRAVTRVGIAVAVVGGTIAVAYTAGESLLLGRIDDDVNRGAAEAIWGSMLGDLRAWGLALGAAGAIVAGAAAAVLRPVDVAAPLRWLAQAAQATPTSTPRRVLRVAVLVVVGVAMVLEPGFVLRALIVAGGLLAIVAGASELLRMTLPEPEHLRERRVERARRWRRASRGLALGGATALAAGLVALVTLTRGEAAPAAGDECNGSRQLCERSLDEVTFPATHNSMSGADYPGFLFPLQQATIPEQLRDGIRALLIDVYYGFPGRRVLTDTDRSSPTVREVAEETLGETAIEAADRIRAQIADPDADADSKLHLCHGLCELGAVDFTETLREIDAFVEQNPSEVLILNIEDYVRPDDVVRAFERSGLIDHVYKGPIGPPWPTLREMIDADERVLVMAENEEGGAAWYHSTYELTQETPFEFESPEQVARGCEQNRGNAGNSLFLLNHWISTDPLGRPTNARKINDREFLVDRARRCQRRRDRLPNLLAVDFYQEGDVQGAAAELNGVERGAG